MATGPNGEDVGADAHSRHGRADDDEGESGDCGDHLAPAELLRRRRGRLDDHARLDGAVVLHAACFVIYTDSRRVDGDLRIYGSTKVDSKHL